MKPSLFLKENAEEFWRVQDNFDVNLAMLRYAKKQLELFEEFIKDNYTFNCHVVEGECGCYKKKMLDKFLIENDLGNI